MPYPINKYMYIYIYCIYIYKNNIILQLSNLPTCIPDNLYLSYLPRIPGPCQYTLLLRS